MSSENDKKKLFELKKTTRIMMQKKSTDNLIEQIISIKEKNKITKKIVPGCYLECFPLPRTRLQKHGEFVIGRESSNDLVLNSSDVSRIHASITWDVIKNNYIIFDLESANGIFVNGRRCKNAILKDKDIIRVGDYNICFYQIGKITTIGYDELEGQKTTIHKPRKEFLDKINNLLKGDLKVVDLGIVLQMIANSKKTGYVKVEEQGLDAYIYFDDGLIVHSEVVDLKGEEAFFIIMGCVNGTFAFVPDKKPKENTMNDEVQYLLLQVAQRDDDASRNQ